MAAKDRLKWDTIYRDSARGGAHYPDADPLLFMYTQPVDAHIKDAPTALDLACGLGQNGLWLAAQGYVVDLVDISRVALQRAQLTAAERDLRRINFLQMDLDDAKIDSAAYDVLCVFRFFNRELFPQLRACVKPGGRVIYEAFNTRLLDLDPEFNAEYLAEVGELSGYFGDWNILKHADNNHVSQVVAIKPEE